MGHLPTIADTIRVTLNWKNANLSRTAHNVLHFHSASYDIAGLNTAIGAHFQAGMWDFVSTASSIDTISYLPLDGSSGTTIITAPATAAFAGQGSGSDCVPQAAGVIRFATGLRGSANRGRTYVPHVAEAEQTNGALADVTACVAAWETMRAAMNTAGKNLEVASYVHAAAHPVTAVSCDGRVRTQRRRQS